MIMVTVNGENTPLSDHSTIEDLLTILDLQDRAVAVEVNQTLIPKKQHTTHKLQSDDHIELVTLVGGG